MAINITEEKNSANLEAFKAKLAQAAKHPTLVDEILLLMRQLVAFEQKYEMTSDLFYGRFTQNDIDKNEDTLEWATKYQMFLAVKQRVG
jgi:hypothetical protein